MDFQLLVARTNIVFPAFSHLALGTSLPVQETTTTYGSCGGLCIGEGVKDSWQTGIVSGLAQRALPQPLRKCIH